MNSLRHVTNRDKRCNVSEQKIEWKSRRMCYAKKTRCDNELAAID